MKFVGLLDNVEGIDVPSYADQGSRLPTGASSASPRISSSTFRGLPCRDGQALDDGMKAVSEDPQFKADMAKMSYRGGYLDSAAAKKFIYRRDSCRG